MCPTLENTALKLVPSNVTNSGLYARISKLSCVQVFGSTGANFTAVPPGKLAGPENRAKYESGNGALCRTRAESPNSLTHPISFQCVIAGVELILARNITTLWRPRPVSALPADAYAPPSAPPAGTCVNKFKPLLSAQLDALAEKSSVNGTTAAWRMNK